MMVEGELCVDDGLECRQGSHMNVGCSIMRSLQDLETVGDGTTDPVWLDEQIPSLPRLKHGGRQGKGKGTGREGWKAGALGSRCRCLGEVKRLREGKGNAFMGTGRGKNEKGAVEFQSSGQGTEVADGVHKGGRVLGRSIRWGWATEHRSESVSDHVKDEIDSRSGRDF